MSKFSVPVVKIKKVENHPDADRLSLVYVMGFVCIAAKLENGQHRYTEDDYVVYIPESSVLNDDLLIHMNFWNYEKKCGTLAGSSGNRVKAIKLRGVFSQGLLYPVYKESDNVLKITNQYGNSYYVNQDDDVAEILQLEKYSPPIPTSLSGEVCNVFGHTVSYDLENYQNFNDIFEENEEVVATEKGHGTNICIAKLSISHEELFGENKNIAVYSKGLGAKGLVFKNNQNNIYNSYVKALLSDEGQRLQNFIENYPEPIFVFSELLGKGIQDLNYNTEPKMFGFDIYVGNPREGRWLSVDEKNNFFEKVGFNQVPVLYRGKFNENELLTHRDGKTIIGNGSHIREGIVITPVNERTHYKLGRVILKMISPDYLLRKNATEYN